MQATVTPLPTDGNAPSGAFFDVRNPTKVGSDDVARKVGETLSTARRPEEPSSTPDRLSQRLDLRIDRTQRGISESSEPRASALGTQSSGQHRFTATLTRSAAYGLRRSPGGSHRWETLSTGKHRWRRGTESPAQPFGEVSAVLERVPARKSDERDLEGDIEPMEDRASRHWQRCGDATNSSTEQGLEADRPWPNPRSGGNVDSGARASASVGKDQVPSASPAKAVRTGEQRQGGSGRGDAVRLTTRRFSGVCASRERVSAWMVRLRSDNHAGGPRKRGEPQGR